MEGHSAKYLTYQGHENKSCLKRCHTVEKTRKKGGNRMPCGILHWALKQGRGIRGKTGGIQESRNRGCYFPCVNGSVWPCEVTPKEVKWKAFRNPKCFVQFFHESKMISKYKVSKKKVTENTVLSLKCWLNCPCKLLHTCRV